MSLPIVIAHHLIWTAYGWLPNDPRGSMSCFVSSEVIFELGNLHQGRKRIQPASRDIRSFYEAAAGKLKFPLLQLTVSDVQAIAKRFARVVEEQRYTCYACALMPDHVHILIRKHKHLAEQMIENFQTSSREELLRPGLRDDDHPLWGGPGWKVFLESPENIRRTIGYIEKNPVKIGLPKQIWDFVSPYDGWPLHPGHDPKSPYAKLLRGGLER
jgi:REP element-mobilizing transposase RayT